uniref:guanylate kinase n=1 Tax=Eubacterium cellulosolvens TaxID=29322 RepID=UPI000480E2BD|nr:guanylate kinase [[Eubacterium] cellulosolvens]
MSHIFYIMGKSASGKDHIYSAILENETLQGKVEPLIIYTTRPMREGEQDGREYFFADAEKLEKLRREGRIIEERVYHTVFGPWHYFTADEGQIDLKKHSYLGIGTLESYRKMVEYFGESVMVPLYIEVDDGLRLERALKRERKQEVPKYREMCRRFLADCEDFSEEKIAGEGIRRRFENNGEIRDCIQACIDYMESVDFGSV